MDEIEYKRPTAVHAINIERYGQLKVFNINSY